MNCRIELDEAGYGSGDFYAEPASGVNARPPARRWYLGKVLFQYSAIGQ